MRVFLVMMWKYPNLRASKSIHQKNNFHMYWLLLIFQCQYSHFPLQPFWLIRANFNKYLWKFIWNTAGCLTSLLTTFGPQMYDMYFHFQSMCWQCVSSGLKRLLLNTAVVKRKRIKASLLCDCLCGGTMLRVLLMTTAVGGRQTVSSVRMWSREKIWDREPESAGSSGENTVSAWDLDWFSVLRGG